MLPNEGKIAHFMTEKIKQQGESEKEFCTIHHRNHNHAISIHDKKKEKASAQISFVCRFVQSKRRERPKAFM